MTKYFQWDLIFNFSTLHCALHACRECALDYRKYFVKSTHLVLLDVSWFREIFFSTQSSVSKFLPFSHIREMWTYSYFSLGSNTAFWFGEFSGLPTTTSSFSAWLKYDLMYFMAINPNSWFVSWIIMGIDTAMAAKMNPKKTEKSLLLQQQHPLLQQELIFDQMKLFHISHYPNSTSLISSILKELLPRSRSRRRQQQREWLQFFTGSLVKPMIMGVHCAKINFQFLRLNQ